MVGCDGCFELLMDRLYLSYLLKQMELFSTFLKQKIIYKNIFSFTRISRIKLDLVFENCFENSLEVVTNPVQVEDGLEVHNVNLHLVANCFPMNQSRKSRFQCFLVKKAFECPDPIIVLKCFLVFSCLQSRNQHPQPLLKAQKCRSLVLSFPFFWKL